MKTALIHVCMQSFLKFLINKAPIALNPHSGALVLTKRIAYL